MMTDRSSSYHNCPYWTHTATLGRFSSAFQAFRLGWIGTYKDRRRAKWCRYGAKVRAGEGLGGGCTAIGGGGRA